MIDSELDLNPPSQEAARPNLFHLNDTILLHPTLMIARKQVGSDGCRIEKPLRFRSLGRSPVVDFPETEKSWTWTKKMIDYIIKVWSLFSRQSKIVASHLFVAYVM